MGGGGQVSPAREVGAGVGKGREGAAGVWDGGRSAGGRGLARTGVASRSVTKVGRPNSSLQSRDGDGAAVWDALTGTGKCWAAPRDRQVLGCGGPSRLLMARLILLRWAISARRAANGHGSSGAARLRDDEPWVRVWGLGFGVWGLGFGVWGLGFGV